MTSGGALSSESELASGSPAALRNGALGVEETTAVEEEPSMSPLD
jgi:hypothetical protein